MICQKIRVQLLLRSKDISKDRTKENITLFKKRMCSIQRALMPQWLLSKRKQLIQFFIRRRYTTWQKEKIGERTLQETTWKGQLIMSPKIKLLSATDSKLLREQELQLHTSRKELEEEMVSRDRPLKVHLSGQQHSELAPMVLEREMSFQPRTKE